METPQIVQEKVYPLGTRIFFYEGTGIGAIVTLGKGSREYVEENQNALSDLIAQAPDPANVYFVYHMQKLSTLSPWLRQNTARVLRDLPPQTRLYVGMLLSNSLVSALMQAFLNSMGDAARKRLSYRIFYQEAEAVQWLLEEQAKHSASAQ
jgi:hypothetical protein